ncbi:MAG: CocE/NonD family hydrolase, partial [Pseudomonadota bacterium]|nr:CocE/NonD family hydrolase [Pseudomonadota bacterium]
ITGSVGNLEIRIKPSGHDVDSGKAVVISHPHPLYGGTMNNKVVTTMERAFSSLGYTTVAYNFRGVGASEGEYDSGVGEQADLKAVLDWLNSRYEISHTVLAGFSFGSYVSLSALEKCKVDAICTVAPPVGLYDFSVVNEVDVPWTLIQGGQDEVVSAQEILDWAMKQRCKPDIYWRDGASHFFHGELVWLRKIIELSY